MFHHLRLRLPLPKRPLHLKSFFLQVCLLLTTLPSHWALAPFFEKMTFWGHFLLFSVYFGFRLSLIIPIYVPLTLFYIFYKIKQNKKLLYFQKIMRII